MWSRLTSLEIAAEFQALARWEARSPYLEALLAREVEREREKACAQARRAWARKHASEEGRSYLRAKWKRYYQGVKADPTRLEASRARARERQRLCRTRKRQRASISSERSRT